MRIIKKNKTKTDCSVVAAFNAASWCNSYRPYKEVEKIAKSCGYNPQRGIYHFQFSNLIKKLQIPAKKIKPKSIDELETKLYLGKCFIFIYYLTGNIGGHVITAFMNHKGNIKLVNTQDGLITWGDFASEIHARGMKEFHVYEIPNRQLVRKHDDSRTA